MAATTTAGDLVEGMFYDRTVAGANLDSSVSRLSPQGALIMMDGCVNLVLCFGDVAASDEGSPWGDLRLVRLVGWSLE